MQILINYLIYIGLIKNNKMRNKLIVLIIVTCLFVLSCNRMESYTNTEFVIANNSKHDLELRYFVYLEQHYSVEDTIFNIPKKSEMRVMYYDDMGSSVYGRPLGLSPDSVYITFNSKRIVYRKGDTENMGIIDIANYYERKVDDNNYEFTYTITSEDYENATEIN